MLQARRACNGSSSPRLFKTSWHATWPCWLIYVSRWRCCAPWLGPIAASREAARLFHWMPQPKPSPPRQSRRVGKVKDVEDEAVRLLPLVTCHPHAYRRHHWHPGARTGTPRVLLPLEAIMRRGPCLRPSLMLHVLRPFTDPLQHVPPRTTSSCPCFPRFPPVPARPTMMVHPCGTPPLPFSRLALGLAQGRGHTQIRRHNDAMKKIIHCSWLVLPLPAEEMREQTNKHAETCGLCNLASPHLSFTHEHTSHLHTHFEQTHPSHLLHRNSA